MLARRNGGVSGFIRDDLVSELVGLAERFSTHAPGGLSLGIGLSAPVEALMQSAQSASNLENKKQQFASAARKPACRL